MDVLRRWGWRWNESARSTWGFARGTGFISVAYLGGESWRLTPGVHSAAIDVKESGDVAEGGAVEEQIDGGELARGKSAGAFGFVL